MEFEPKMREEKGYSEVRVSGQPPVLMVSTDSGEIPDRRSKSHNNQGGAPIGESLGTESDEKQIRSAPTLLKAAGEQASNEQDNVSETDLIASKATSERQEQDQDEEQLFEQFVASHSSLNRSQKMPAINPRFGSSVFNVNEDPV